MYLNSSFLLIPDVKDSNYNFILYDCMKISVHMHLVYLITACVLHMFIDISSGYTAQVATSLKLEYRVMYTHVSIISVINNVLSLS